MISIYLSNQLMVKIHKDILETSQVFYGLKTEFYKLI